MTETLKPRNPYADDADRAADHLLDSLPFPPPGSERDAFAINVVARLIVRLWARDGGGFEVAGRPATAEGLCQTLAFEAKAAMAERAAANAPG